MTCSYRELAAVAEGSARFIAPTPAAAAAMSTVFPSTSVPAGTPIILAPRVPQLSSVTSHVPSATMLTCRPPSVGSAADTAAAAAGTVIYPLDPYVQQVLEYSTQLQHNPTGCSHMML